MAKQSHVSYGQKTKSLVKLIEQAAYRHSVWQVFSDFLEMSAVSISNSIDPVHREDRERRYMEIVKGYNKAEMNLFPQMLTELVKSLEQCAQEKSLDDILGKTFHELELHNKYKGQFFTPQSVCNMMGSITAIDAEKALEQQKYLTICEPCIGSGAMILGLANDLARKNINYCQRMVVTGTDIDLKCVHMAYLQLSLYGIPAVIIHGNTLTCEEWSRWYTPVYIAEGWIFRQRCGITADAGRETDERLKMALDPIYAAFRKIDAITRAQPKNEDKAPIKKTDKKKLWFFFFEPQKEDI